MAKATQTAPQCPGRTVNGEPCSARPQPGREHCQWHDPLRAEERAQWRAQGGRARSQRSRAVRDSRKYSTDLGALRNRLFQAFKQVEAGDLDPEIATSMANLAGAIVVVASATGIDHQRPDVDQWLGAA